MSNKYNVSDGFDALDLPVYNASAEFVDRIYNATMKKAGLPIIHRVPGKRLLILAAVIAVGILTVAASYLSASDVMRGYLKENHAFGGAEPLYGLSSIVDQTGTVLDVAASSSGGIRVTPKAIAGDDCSFVLLFELESEDGTPLGLALEDGALSEGMIYFTRSQLVSTLTPINHLFSSGMFSKNTGNTATVLQRFDLYDTVPQGETVHLELTKLQQRASLPGTQVGLDAQIFRQFLQGAPASPQGELVAIESLEPRGMGGPSIDDGILAIEEDSGFTAELEGPLDGYTLTNVVVRDGWAYLRGYAPLTSDPSRDLRSAVLMDSEGEAIPLQALHYGDHSDRGYQPWGLAFAGIASDEQLLEQSLLVDYGDRPFVFAEGSWEFDIPLQYDSVSREFTPGTQMSMNGVNGTLTRLVISPYRVIFDFVPAAGDSALWEQAATYPYEDITLVTGDGIRISPPVQDVTQVVNADGERVIRGFFFLLDIIDPEQVVAFYYGDMSCSLL